LASNCEAGVISGGSESTGGAQSGSNSIGVSDLQRLYNSIDQASLVSPKCAWLMNSSTRQFIGSIIDKVGRNLNLIEYRDGKEYIFGKPLYIAPSLPSLGSAAIPIIFGDLSAWVTRHAVDGNRIQFFFQAPGLAEKGEFGIRLFERWDGALMANGFSTTPPIKVLINHS
jgi:HK97 family phage major capsid protein